MINAIPCSYASYRAFHDTGPFSLGPAVLFAFKTYVASGVWGGFAVAVVVYQYWLASQKELHKIAKRFVALFSVTVLCCLFGAGVYLSHLAFYAGMTPPEWISVWIASTFKLCYLELMWGALFALLGLLTNAMVQAHVGREANVLSKLPKPAFGALYLAVAAMYVSLLCIVAMTCCISARA